MPFFSVVIPLYNKERHIEDTLQSVLNQTFKDFEIIIVNDGSTDDSLKKVETFKDERIRVFSHENRGASETRNFGIENAKAMHIALIDADDIWFPNHLEEHHKAICKFPDCALYTNAYKLKMVDDHLIDAIYNVPTQKAPIILEDFFLASTIHPVVMTSSIVFKKSDFNDLGGYNPEIISGQDVDLMIRFGLHKTVVFNPVRTCYYDKTVPYSLSKENHQHIKLKMLSSFSEFEKTNESLRRYLALNRYSLAIQCKQASNKITLKKLLPQIDKSYLTSKQKVLLAMPKQVLKYQKTLYYFLIKNGRYISTYK